jgi:hypothetical protein
VLNRYHQAGIGAPLAAELAASGEGAEAEAARKRIPPRLRVPVTALLRFGDISAGIASGQVKGEMEIYSSDLAETVDIGGRRVPLELEPTAALAYQLEDAPIWDTELSSFLSALRPPSPESLVMLHPYRPASPVRAPGHPLRARVRGGRGVDAAAASMKKAEPPETDGTTRP